MLRAHQIVFLAAAAGMLAGCTRVVVTKNPGCEDEGIRYYRPKPYLMIAPAAAPVATGEGKGEQATYVSISIQYLPDYNEEYSIKLKSGLGVGKLAVTLENGWNLTSVDLTTDQQVDELIGSVASLLSAGAQIARSPGQAAVRAETDRDVPIGLYEAVIAERPGCGKGIFGWRYIGFAPFNTCPVCPIENHDYVDCTGLWTLVGTNGGLAFRQLDLSGVNPRTGLPLDVEPKSSSVDSTIEPPAEPQETRINDRREKWNLTSHFFRKAS